MRQVRLDTVMLSHAYWLRLFNGNPAAVGQSLIVNGTPREIIGVLPENFRFLRYNPLVVLPFRFNRAEVMLGNFSYQGVARLKPGVTIEQANADVARLIPTMVDRFRLPPGFTPRDVRRGAPGTAGAAPRRSMSSATSAACCGSCSARWGSCCWWPAPTSRTCSWCGRRVVSRSWRCGWRSAPGRAASRASCSAESVLLGLLGRHRRDRVSLTRGIRLLVYLQPARLPRLYEITLDPIVLLFTLAISLAAGLLFGLIPVLKYARPRLADALKENGRGSSDGRERHRARNALVVAQVALAVVLLVASGLMVRTFVAMRDVSPGFVRPEEVLTLRISIPERGRREPGTGRAHARADRAPPRGIGGVSRSAWRRR